MMLSFPTFLFNDLHLYLFFLLLQSIRDFGPHCYISDPNASTQEELFFLSQESALVLSHQEWLIFLSSPLKVSCDPFPYKKKALRRPRGLQLLSVRPKYSAPGKPFPDTICTPD